LEVGKCETRGGCQGYKLLEECAMSINPYASPQLAPASPAELPAVALAPFLAWERLRIWYNTILMLVVVLSVLPFRNLWFSDRLNFYCIEGAILANICFCVGLVAESYLRMFGWWQSWQRWALFAAGTLLAALLAAAGIAGPLSRF
jgi:hypothetical protein